MSIDVKCRKSISSEKKKNGWNKEKQIHLSNFQIRMDADVTTLMDGLVCPTHPHELASCYSREE